MNDEFVSGDLVKNNLSSSIEIAHPPKNPVIVSILCTVFLTNVGVSSTSPSNKITSSPTYNIPSSVIKSSNPKNLTSLFLYPKYLDPSVSSHSLLSVNTIFLVFVQIVLLLLANTSFVEYVVPVVNSSNEI